MATLVGELKGEMGLASSSSSPQTPDAPSPAPLPASVGLAADQNFDGWILPVRDAVTDRYQSTCFMPVMAVSLEPEGQWKTEFKLAISH